MSGEEGMAIESNDGQGHGRSDQQQVAQTESSRQQRYHRAHTASQGVGRVPPPPRGRPRGFWGTCSRCLMAAVRRAGDFVDGAGVSSVPSSRNCLFHTESAAQNLDVLAHLSSAPRSEQTTPTKNSWHDGHDEWASPEDRMEVCAALVAL